jgi:putative ATP-binding cassette transporter
MSDRPQVPDRSESDHSGLIRQLGQMLRALYASPVGRPLMSLVIATVIVIGLTAYGQIRLNQWNKPFYDALSRRDFPDFVHQLGVFLVIAVALLVLNVIQRWLVETLKYRLREGLMLDLVGHWLQPRRAFWLASSGSMGSNPDQRMHEDTRKLCELSADLGVGLLQATMLFTTFAGVLWVLSEDFSFRFRDADYAVPGFMLWAAIVYAVTGSLLSYWVGRSLIGRNADRYAREAELRFTLVRINEHVDGITLGAGEEDEQRRVRSDLNLVLDATRRLVVGLTNLTWITAGFGWLTIIAPILVAVPLYFAGKMSFGGLMMAAAAFTQAQSSLRWFVDNFSVIADWRATLLRVGSFRQALTEDRPAPVSESAPRVHYLPGEAGWLAIEGLEIHSPAGSDRLSETTVRIHAGERVQILNAPGTGKTPLFRALAGLWPWGRGTVSLPTDKAQHYLPAGTPYLPRGTLREVLAYPQPADRFDDAAYRRVLDRFSLIRLQTMLDVEQRWDRELSQDEQLSVAFARVLLHTPSWVFVDDGFGALDRELLQRVVDVFTHELAATGIVHIGRPAIGSESLFSRTLHLVRAIDSDGPQGAAP